MTNMKRILVSVVTLALIALVTAIETNAEVFGQCAHQRNVDIKIASCTAASKATSYPPVLRWVFRELARAHRQRGEIGKAIASYAQSLAVEDREAVRREMEELTLITQAETAKGPARAAVGSQRRRQP